MLARRLLATAVTAAVVAGAAAAASAERIDATTAAPAAGTAGSELELLRMTVAEHDIRVGGLALLSDTVGTSAARVRFTPVTVDGTSYGERTWGPAEPPATAPGVDSADLLPSDVQPLVQTQTPAVQVAAATSDGASSRAGASSLGSVSVLGLPLRLDGQVEMSSVVDRTVAVSQKHVTVTGLALPSVADVLGALGLDVALLPASTLTELLSALQLTSPAVVDAQRALDAASAALREQIDAAQTAVDGAAAALDGKTAELDEATGQLGEARAELASAAGTVTSLGAVHAAAQRELDAAGDALIQADRDLADATAAVQALVTPLLDFGAVLAAFPSLAATYDDAVSAQAAAQAAAGRARDAEAGAAADLAAAQTIRDEAAAAVTLLQGTVTALQAAVDALQDTLDQLRAALDLLLSTVRSELDGLLAAATAVLDATPLVSVDRISISTRASTSSADPGGQDAGVVGSVTGLRVLGADVLAAALGTSTVDLLSLSATQRDRVDGVVARLTTTLSHVLSTVPSYPALSVPVPQIGLLASTASTDSRDGFGTAGNQLQALTVTVPAITVPADLAVPGIGSLPAVAGLPVLAAAVGTLAPPAGSYLSHAVALSVVTVTESSRFRPASLVVAEPTAPVPAVPGPTEPVPTVPPPPTGPAPTAPAPATPAPAAPAPTGPVPTLPPEPEASDVAAPVDTSPDVAADSPTAPVPDSARTDLPRTGGSSGVALLATLVVGAALVLRRRWGRPSPSAVMQGAA